jgi:GDP-L-fucose synthase
MNILLTGGSGFIGRNILGILSDRHYFFSPCHKELDLIDENTVRNYFLNNKIDIVIHSATKPGHRNSPNATNLLYCNARMFFNLARNSNHFESMIVIGSGAVYDMRHFQPKMKEEYFDTYVPIDEHGFNKYICGKYIDLVENVLDLRLFGIFGKYEDYSIRFISNAICKAIFDLPITIKQNRKFDYIWVNDLMPILDYFIVNRGKHKAYNVTPNMSVELYSIAEKVRDISGKKIPILVAQEGMGVEYSGDNSRLRNDIGDISLTPLEKSIEELYKWYYDNKSNIDYNNLLLDK